jgi:thiamine biosynthesis lipoprotein
LLYRCDGRALGSPLSLLVEGSASERSVAAAWRAVLDAFARVDASMSRFRADSELTRLNRAGRPMVDVSRTLRSAMTLADRAGRVTRGTFDARVLVDLERLGAPGVPQVPGPGPGPRSPGCTTSGAERDEAVRLFSLDRRTGELDLRRPLDLGGLGKGLALRWAARAAGGHLAGFGFLLDAGGDIVCRGSVDGGPWSIGIEDPSGDAEPVATCALFPGDAIATSSVRRGRWHDPSGRPVHHLIDPATGEPGGAGLSAVTVAWSDPAWAEIWSKSLFLAGAAGIAAEARGRDLAAWWVSEDGELSMTPAARQRTTWVRSEARRAERTATSASSTGA